MTNDEIRDRLVELLLDVDYALNTNGRGVRDVADFVAEYLIAKGVTVQEWIPVSEQKPEENKDVPFYADGRLTFTSVLAYTNEKGVTIANRVNVLPIGIPYLDEQATSGWEWSVGNEGVTHWMPLPMPPKEET